MRIERVVKEFLALRRKTVSEEKNNQEHKANIAVDDGDTLVFEKNNALDCTKMIEIPTVVLTVLEGQDQGKKEIIKRCNRINIGRREENEMVLSDINASRLHAYIMFEKGRYVLYDAKSLNGTYLNGRRIINKELEPKDKIKIGSTVICYEQL